jgi:hypothetical protein
VRSSTERDAALVEHAGSVAPRERTPPSRWERAQPWTDDARFEQSELELGVAGSPRSSRLAGANPLGAQRITRQLADPGMLQC